MLLCSHMGLRALLQAHWLLAELNFSSSIIPGIRVFSSESVLLSRWPTFWSFSFSISLSNEYSGWISFRTDWLALLAVQDTLKSLQHHSSKASILWGSAFFMIQLSHPYMKTGKITALARWTFVRKVYAISYSQIHLLIYCNSNTISSKLFLLEYVKTDSQVYVD